MPLDRKIVNMSYQSFHRLSSWRTAQNIIPSNGTVYKVPLLFSPFLRYDIIADKAHMLSRLQGKPLREEAENRWVNRLTIEPQTFCDLRKIGQTP